MTVTELNTLERQVESLVGDVRNLPTPPLVFSQINRVVNDPNTSAYDVAAILSEDPAMSAKVLKIANSAFYGFANPVPTVKQAVVMLGMNEIKNIVYSASALTAFKGVSVDREFQDQFWRHSLGVAVGARILTRKLTGEHGLAAETAFSAGLLHDIGKMVVACYAAPKRKEILAAQRQRGSNDREAEQEVLGLDHTHVGTYLGKRWNLPIEVMGAIAYHHAPLTAPEHQTYAAVVNTADCLAHIVFEQDNTNAAQCVTPDPDVMQLIKVTNEKLEALKSSIVEEFGRSETFLRMALG